MTNSNNKKGKKITKGLTHLCTVEPTQAIEYKMQVKVFTFLVFLFDAIREVIIQSWGHFHSIWVAENMSLNSERKSIQTILVKVLKNIS